MGVSNLCITTSSHRCQGHQLLVENCDFCPSWGGGPRRNIAITFGVDKLEWHGYPMAKKIEDIFTRSDRIHKRDGRTDGSIARQKLRRSGYVDCVGARLYEAVDSRGASEARKSLCQQDSDLMCSDDDDDSLLDSEVSELLRSRSPRTLVSPDHSPYKRLRQPDCVRPAPATSSPGRSLHAGAITPLPRPSLDLYKMQVSRRNYGSVNSS